MENAQTKDGVHIQRCVRACVAWRRRGGRPFVLHQRNTRPTPPHTTPHARHRSTQANKYSQEELLLMKTQDVKYLSPKSRHEAAVSTE